MLACNGFLVLQIKYNYSRSDKTSKIPPIFISLERKATIAESPFPITGRGSEMRDKSIPVRLYDKQFVTILS